MLHRRHAQAAEKNVQTDYVCSGAQGAPCAGQFNRRSALVHYCTTLMCHCEEANGRRGALSAKREEVPLGCNLGKALPNCTGQCRGADSRARRNAADSNGPPLKWQRLPDLSLRGRFAPSQSREGSYVFAGAFLLSTPVLRDSPVASLLGMAILIALRRRITTAIRATAVGAH